MSQFSALLVRCPNLSAQVKERQQSWGEAHISVVLVGEAVAGRGGETLLLAPAPLLLLHSPRQHARLLHVAQQAWTRELAVVKYKFASAMNCNNMLMAHCSDAPALLLGQALKQSPLALTPAERTMAFKRHAGKEKSAHVLCQGQVAQSGFRIPNP